MHQSGHECKKSLGLSTETPGVLTPSYEQVGPEQTNNSEPSQQSPLSHHRCWNLLKLQQCNLNLMLDGR